MNQKGLKGLGAIALIALFAQCTNKTTNQSPSTTEGAMSSKQGLKVAYVEVDSLLSRYNFCIDLNEAMVKKGENVRMTISQKAGALEKAKQEFQQKYENNAFLSKERAEQEYSRLVKMEQDLQELSNKLQADLMEENNKNSLQLRDSINAFLKDYNKVHGYNLIFSNTGFDNLLYADSAFNITKEVIEGLNARYSPAVKK
ncbi:MAG: OmpH family outer membrane protein [Bacteroides sp.]|nr:OmpH family outer membrane protein [Bacteroides sp.]